MASISVDNRGMKLLWIIALFFDIIRVQNDFQFASSSYTNNVAKIAQKNGGNSHRRYSFLHILY